jgi:glycosyltransferase involved in cell wall biosynthesis
MMHILLIHQAFAALGEPGGTRHHEISRHLVDQGHKVTALVGQVSYLTGLRTARGWLHRETDDVGVAIWRCYTYPAWHKSFLHRMVSFFSFMISSFIAGLRVKDVDLVWGTSPPIFQGVTAWIVARLKRKPFLFEVRDLWPYFAVAVGVLKQPLLVRLSEWLERFLYRRADVVVVNSPGYTDHVRSHGASIVKLVPNGVDVSMFDPTLDGKEFRKVLGIEDKYVMLYAGAHGMSNDLQIVLEAAKSLRKREDILFVFVGDGKEKKSLMALSKTQNLENVRFLPPVPKKEMPVVLAAADACLAILKPLEAYKTTFPNKVFDYMAAGRPVILAIDGVIREVVEGAAAGIFVEPGDPKDLAAKVLRLADDPQAGMRMGKAGRKHVVEHFERTFLAARMGQVMDDLVHGKREGSYSEAS